MTSVGMSVVRMLLNNVTGVGAQSSHEIDANKCSLCFFFSFLGAHFEVWS